MYEDRKLTEKQKKVLEFIVTEVRHNNLPPTIREIAKKFKFSSTGTVRDYLKALVQKGYINIAAGKSRAIGLIKEVIYSIPILGKVQAGAPILAVEQIDGYLNLDRLIFSDDETFALKVRGDSMIDDGIMPDDLVIVRKQSMAQTGETIVALIDNEATVKRLQKKGAEYYLQPANEQYLPIRIDQKVSIIGKVISVIRKLS